MTLLSLTSDFCRWLLELPRVYKRVILIGADLLLLTFAMVAAWWLRLMSFDDMNWTAFGAALLAPPITVATFAYLGLYRLVTRYIGNRGIGQIAAGVVLSTTIWALVLLMSGHMRVPRSTVPLYAILGIVFIVSSRYVASWVLTSSGIRLPRAMSEPAAPKNVVIYGAGPEGVRLLQAVKSVDNRRVVGFVDSDRSLWGQYVGQTKVYNPPKLKSLIEARNVAEVLIALPASRRRERRDVLEQLRGKRVDVKVLPALEDLARGDISVSDLKPIDVEDLLGRDAVPADTALLKRSITGKSILVTGAGGSIGSELVRQILRLRPERLVLNDVSEYALYEIDLQAREIAASLPPTSRLPEIVLVLGSVLDEPLVRDTITKNAIDTIFHAAAYKHVPIVETNAVVGLENNTFGTAIVAKCAAAAGVERFVLVSTDKAVRPTNVMGASKRLAELVLQGLAAEPGCRTVFTMVRFGNVLDSSGSVVALFRRQIKAGGPVTVTHPDVTRYFMSIPEAAGLVIQAGAMARGGEVFVLEMGEPVKIDDLARLMVRLTGLDVRTKDDPDGDIEVVYCGLRPGEKLYEELLIGANTEPTEHPRIMRSGEPFLSIRELAREFDTLRQAMAARDLPAIEAILSRTVEGYQSAPNSDRPARVVASTAAPSRTLH
ncbi:MAG: polysaccharide biosynthesis protein [Hyphomicrobiaceae bacterium]|nr:polysaccharide biosynthesis protein [Hyphomicrobiaceae bacterium]